MCGFLADFDGILCFRDHKLLCFSFFGNGFFRGESKHFKIEELIKQVMAT